MGACAYGQSARHEHFKVKTYPLTLADPRFKTLQFGIEKQIRSWAFDGAYGFRIGRKSGGFFDEIRSGRKLRLGVSWFFTPPGSLNPFLKLEFFHHQFQANSYDNWYNPGDRDEQLHFDSASNTYKARGLLISIGNRIYTDKKEHFFVDMSFGLGSRFVSNHFYDIKGIRPEYAALDHILFWNREAHTDGSVSYPTVDARLGLGLKL
jgi:hypothetical protein